LLSRKKGGKEGGTAVLIQKRHGVLSQGRNGLGHTGGRGKGKRVNLNGKNHHVEKKERQTEEKRKGGGGLPTF